MTTKGISKEMEPMLATNSISEDVMRQAAHKNATIDFDVDEYIRDAYEEANAGRTLPKVLVHFYLVVWTVLVVVP